MRMLTEQQEREYRALELVYDDESAWTMLSAFIELMGEGPARSTIVTLKEQGLIQQNGKSYPGYQITATGRVRVEQMRARRSNRGLRRKACREALLRWVDDQTRTDDPGSRVAREDFAAASADLLPFSEEEAGEAAAYLAENGFIKSVSAWGAPHLLVWVTARGQEAVDSGGVEAFLKSERQVSPVNHFTVTGNGNNLAAAVGDGNTVNQTVSAFDIEKALEFAAAVRQALSALDLPTEAAALIDEIEQREDLRKAQRATARLYQFVTAVSTGTLGQILGVAGAAALGIGV